MSSGEPSDAAIRAWAAAHIRSVGTREPAERQAVAEVPWTPDAPASVTARKVRTIEMRSAISAAPAVLPDGDMLVAVSGFLDSTRIYRGLLDSVVHRVGDGPGVVGRFAHVASAVLPDGRALFATTAVNGDVHVWNGRDGTRQMTLATHRPGPMGASWAVLPDGRALLAVVSHDSGSVRVWDGESGAQLHAGTGDGGISYHRPIGWAVLPDGRTLLSSGAPSGVVGTWDINDRWSRRLLECHSEPVQGMDWAVLRDGQVLLATSSDDHTVRIWDFDSGSCLFTLTGFSKVLWRVRWAALPDGRLLLAAGGRDRNLCVWNGRTGELLLTLDGQQEVRDIRWAQLPDGSLYLITACGDGVHLWDVAVDPPVPPPQLAESGDSARVARAVGPRSGAAGRSTAVGVVVACAGAGLWPPLGLAEDLLAMTGPDGVSAELHDARLGVLAGHAGMRRLRELGWPRAARAAFAVLLASELTADNRFAPPPEAGPGDLRAALTGALGNGAAGWEPGSVPVRELAAAAEAISPRMISLLTIIGPDAAAADPVLALRMAHLAGQLPELSSAQLRVIRAGPRPRDPGARADGGATIHSPGTAGVSRHGQLAQMLHTQLALPPDLLEVRILRDQVLYRRHRGVVPARPQPLTLVLDVTPPTFGAVEQALRLVAHLITVALWERGQNPVLVSLARPRLAIPLAGRAQLARLWLSRTLDPPGDALPVALRTAAGLPYPVVILAHQQAQVPVLTPDPGRVLIAARHSAEPPSPTAGPARLNLPPHPTEADLTEAVTFALAHDHV